MKRSHQTWLREEAAAWVKKEIITQEQADEILAGYPEKEILPLTFQRTFSVLGAVLIGVGLLLVLAHNWDALSRGVRLTSVLVLLLLSQGGTLLAMHTERLARYREGLSLVQSLMVGASLLLMAQTYYLGMDSSWLFGVWMVLILPIAVLAETVLPIFAYAVLFFVWLGQAHNAWYIWFSWPLLFALVPLQRRLEENETRGCRALAWLMVVALSATFLVCFRAYFGDFAVQIMAVFFYCLSALGIRLDRTDEFWDKPLFSLGLSGSLLCTFLLTFYNLWHRSEELVFGAPFFLLIGTLAVAFFFVWQHSRIAKKDWLLRLSSMMVPVIGITSLLWLAGLPDWLAVGIMNLYLLVIGLFLLGRGYGRQQVSVFNIGMLLVSALIIARFFDVDMNFLVRGVLYIVLGMIFLGVNYRMMKQKGGTAGDENTVLQRVESSAAGSVEADAVRGDDADGRDEYDLARSIRETEERSDADEK